MAMAVSSVNCVYWEWQRDDGGFSPYIPSNSNAIEAANHAGLGGHNSGSYTIDFARMIQRKNATGTKKLKWAIICYIWPILKIFGFIPANIMRVSTSMTKYTRMMHINISSYLGFERQVKRQLIVLPSTPDITAYWMWNEHGSNFVLYDIQSSVDIELSFLNGYPSLDLSKCTSRLPYTIDFGKMEQTRHHYNTRRRIQRCLLPVGFSLQNLLALAPGLTGSASLASGGGVTMPHSTSGTGGGGGGGGFAAFSGYGSGPVPTPAMMNSGMPSGPPAGMVNFAPSVPPSASYGGHVMKSGGISTSTPYSLPGPTPSLSTTHMSKSGAVAASSSTPATINSMTTGAVPSFPSAPGGHVAVAKPITNGGLTSKGSSRTSGRKTRTLAVLGAAIPAPVSSTSHTAHAAPLSTAAAVHVPSYTGSTTSSSSAFTLPPSLAKASLTSATTSTGAVSPQKRRRKNKTASNYTGHSSGAATSTVSSVMATSNSKGGSSTGTVVAVKTEKSKARGRRREKKGAAAKSGGRSKDYGDETSKYARKKKKLKKGEDGVSKLTAALRVNISVDNYVIVLSICIG